MIFSVRKFTSGARAYLGILLSRWLWGGPYQVSLEISNVCDTDCIMCWCHSPQLPGDNHNPDANGNGIPVQRRSFMEPDLLESILRQCHEMGTYLVILGGDGDPALHPQIDYMLERVIRLGMKPFVMTNGISFDAKRAQRWAGIPGYFRFALHAGDIDTWLRVHPAGRPKQYEQLCRTIRTVVLGGKAQVSLIHVLQKANMKTLRTMLKQASELGVKEVEFFPVQVTPGLGKVMLTPDEEHELRGEIESALPLAEHLGIRTNLRAYLKTNLHVRSGKLETENLYRTIPCYIGWVHAEFEIDGAMKPCLRSKIGMGSVDRDHIRDMWLSSRYWDFRHAARRMPRSAGLVEGCECERCCLANVNIHIYNLLHLKSLGEPEQYSGGGIMTICLSHWG